MAERNQLSQELHSLGFERRIIDGALEFGPSDLSEAIDYCLELIKGAEQEQSDPPGKRQKTESDAQWEKFGGLDGKSSPVAIPQEIKAITSGGGDDTEYIYEDEDGSYYEIEVELPPKDSPAPRKGTLVRTQSSSSEIVSSSVGSENRSLVPQTKVTKVTPFQKLWLKRTESATMEMEKLNSFVQEYILRTPKNVVAKLSEQAAQISSVYPVHTTQALMMLAHHKRRFGNVMERCCEDLDKELEAAGAVYNKNESPPSEAGVCLVCADDDPSTQFFSLSCGHCACKDCWASYLEGKIGEGQVFITCPQYKCTYRTDPSFLEPIVSSESIEKYRLFLARTILLQDPKSRWCPNPKCDIVIEGFNIMEVSCLCGQLFCLSCGLAESHYPASCAELANWTKLASSDAASCGWISMYSKKCPNCGTSIEKNMGCNHMHCVICDYHFCWACMKSTKDHYACDGGEDEVPATRMSSKEKEDSVKLLEHDDRFQFQTKRAQKASALLKTLWKNVQKMCVETNRRLEDFEYMKIACEALVQARKVLKYSYVHAFHITDDAWQSIFKLLQAELEEEVDRLDVTLQLEAPWNYPRQTLVDQTSGLKKRLDNIVEGAFRNMEQSKASKPSSSSSKTNR
eukprot:TRINITY_DN5509_c0_g2_i1.p1 TRINITY_DN5509_c0_g2~~TRINITY_DN5509_c0_g2_i1.p1  ORF type:complete len:627 (+),score=111.41 TRINITY_DN5509_c0_g2_i1:44-1924(+)